MSLSIETYPYFYIDSSVNNDWYAADAVAFTLKNGSVEKTSIRCISERQTVFITSYFCAETVTHAVIQKLLAIASASCLFLWAMSRHYFTLGIQILLICSLS